MKKDISRNKGEEKEKREKRIIELERVKSELTDLWLKTKLEETPIVGKNDIAAIVSEMTGIPLVNLSEEERTKLKNLEERIHQRIVNQEEATRVVSESIRRARAGLKDPHRPIGSFIFLGPTGVGKTELTKALAEVLYGSEELMVRVDMSEYMEKHTVSRLIGAPPGYIGFERGGQLTEIVRRKPFSVILLDEVEKAHTEVFNVLLQIMEDGRLTDGRGRTVDFKNTIIIMTSNVGSDLINRYAIGFENQQKDYRGSDAERYTRLRDKVMQSLRQTFRPEFLNRVDEIVVFHTLTRGQIRLIAEKLMSQVVGILAEKRITLEITDKAREWLAKKGYDPDFGARPMRRLIQKEIENVISDMIIAEEVKEGSRLLVDVLKDRIQIRKVAK